MCLVHAYIHTCVYTKLSSPGQQQITQEIRVPGPSWVYVMPQALIQSSRFDQVDKLKPKVIRNKRTLSKPPISSTTAQTAQNLTVSEAKVIRNQPTVRKLLEQNISIQTDQRSNLGLDTKVIGNHTKSSSFTDVNSFLDTNIKTVDTVLLGNATRDLNRSDLDLRVQIPALGNSASENSILDNATKDLSSPDLDLDAQSGQISALGSSKRDHARLGLNLDAHVPALGSSYTDSNRSVTHPSGQIASGGQTQIQNSQTQTPNSQTLYSSYLNLNIPVPQVRVWGTWWGMFGSKGLVNFVDLAYAAHGPQGDPGYSYVCMYIYIYICMHACMHACMYVCMYVCMSTWRIPQGDSGYTCVRMHAFMYVCMYVGMHVCIYTHTCVYANQTQKYEYTSIHTYIHIHKTAHTHIHTYIHIHTHAHTHTHTHTHMHTIHTCMHTYICTGWKGTNRGKACFTHARIPYIHVCIHIYVQDGREQTEARHVSLFGEVPGCFRAHPCAQQVWLVIHACMYVRMYVCIHACMYIHTYVCMCDSRFG
jgi:hypothetical protein